MKTLTEVVEDAVASSDCYCRPGDATCQDWINTPHRWRTQTKAVVEALQRLPLRTRLALLFKRV